MAGVQQRFSSFLHRLGLTLEQAHHGEQGQSRCGCAGHSAIANAGAATVAALHHLGFCSLLMTGRQLSQMRGHRYIACRHARCCPGTAETLQKQGQCKQAVQERAAHNEMIDQRRHTPFALLEQAPLAHLLRSHVGRCKGKAVPALG